jgi:hypothetical protein
MNKDKQINFFWDLSGEDLDMLSKLVKGKVSIINSDDISAYLIGMIGKIADKPNNKPTSIQPDYNKLMSIHPDKRDSYLRGWNQVGNKINKK